MVYLPQGEDPDRGGFVLAAGQAATATAQTRVANLVHFYDAVDRLQLDVEQVVPIHGRLTPFSEVREAVEAYGNTQLWTK